MFIQKSSKAIRKNRSSSCVTVISNFKLSWHFLYVFLIYITMLSVTHAVWRRTDGWEWHMNWRVFTWKRSLLNLSYFPWTFLHWLRKPTKTLRIIVVLVEIQIKYFQNAGQKLCLLTQQLYLTAVNVMGREFWDLTPCSLVNTKCWILLPEGGSRFRLNVGSSLQNYKTLNSSWPYF